MEDRRAQILAASVALIGASTTLLTVRKYGSFPTVLLVGLFVIGALGLLGIIGFWGCDWYRSWRATREARKPIVRPSPAFTGLWRNTTEGAEAPEASTALQKSMNHPGESRDSVEPPVGKISFVFMVPCDRLTDQSTSGLIKSLQGLLSQPPMSNWVEELTPRHEGATWYHFDSNGPLATGMALGDAEDTTQAPLATALLNLNDRAVRYQQFQDSRRAELVLTIKVRQGADDSPFPAMLATWHKWLEHGMDLCAEFAAFLDKELDLKTYADVQSQVAVQLEGMDDLTGLIAPGDVERAPGASQRRSFQLYLLADRDGKPSREAAIDALRSCCDFGLYVHGYEAQLDALRHETAEP